MTHPPPDATERTRLDWLLLAALSALPLVLYVASTLNADYGYFIDEFYYIACAKRLAFGYVDHPPLAPLVLVGFGAKMDTSLFTVASWPVRRPMERSRYIAIEGAVCAGKTPLATLLTERMGGRLVAEPVEDNPFLPSFYDDRKKHAFQAQIFFLLSRFQQQQQLFQQDLFSQVAVADYLFVKDRIYASITLDPNELALYERVYDLLGPRIVKPDLVIYLPARVEVLLSRVRRSGRPYERNIDPVYLECSACQALARIPKLGLFVSEGRTSGLGKTSNPAAPFSGGALRAVLVAAIVGAAVQGNHLHARNQHPARGSQIPHSRFGLSPVHTRIRGNAWHRVDGPHQNRFDLCCLQPLLRHRSGIPFRKFWVRSGGCYPLATGLAAV